MARLTAPNGASVEVSDEKAKRLLASPTLGFKSAEKKAPAKTAAASKSDK